MNGEKTPLSKDIEDLVNKSIEANKTFLAESSRIVQQFTLSPGKKENRNVFQANFLTDAFNAYAKLNIQYVKNFLDISVSLLKQAGTQQTTESAPTANTDNQPVASFVLRGEVDAGEKISLSFLLDNVKDEAVTCNFINTEYRHQTDLSVKENFNTIFSPQSFPLNAAEQRRINIDISVPPEAKPGLYISDVQVQGFEPAFFSIFLTVNERKQ